MGLFDTEWRLQVFHIRRWYLIDRCKVKKSPNYHSSSVSEMTKSMEVCIEHVGVLIMKQVECLSMKAWLIFYSLCFVLYGNYFSLSLPAPPRQCIDLHFAGDYSIESSWECKFDNIEVRDGPFGFSPILGRYCGQHSPPDIRSSGRYLWIKFVTDGELEAVGFSASYNFTAGTNFFVVVFLTHCSCQIISFLCKHIHAL